MEYSLSYKFIWVDYTNYKGVRRLRQIMPLRLVFGATPYHSPEQWLLECVDIEDKHIIKMFALSGIHGMNISKEALDKISSPGFQPNGADSLSLSQQLAVVCTPGITGTLDGPGTPVPE